MKHWYTLYTKPQNEYVVSQALAEMGIETYIPEFASGDSSSSGKPLKQEQPTPYFPCYMFMKVDLTEYEISKLQWVPGLRRILTFGDRPVPVDDALIDLCRTRLQAQTLSKGDPKLQFKSGDKLRIVEGPFHDMIAILETEPTSATQRVHVLLTLMNRRYQVDLSYLEQMPDTTTRSTSITPTPKRKRRTRGRGRHIKSTANQS